MELEKQSLHNFVSPETLSQIRRDLDSACYSITTRPGLTKDDFLNLSYAFGEVVAPGRGYGLATELNTTDEIGERLVPLHNDKSYWRVPPRLLLLYMADAKGIVAGQTILANLCDSFRAMSSNDQASLRKAEAILSSPQNRDKGQICASVVNEVNGELAFFRFRLDLVKSDTPAFSRLYELACSKAFPVTLNQGDLLILDNWVMAHGRTETTFSQGGHRLAYRSLVI